MNPLNPQIAASGPLNGTIDTHIDSFGIDLSILEPIRIPFKFNNRHFVLTEAPVDAVVKWRNAQLQATRIVDGKAAGFVNMADTEPLLVSYCLFYAAEPNSTEILMAGPGNKVPQAPGLNVIRGWPNRAVKPLFDKIKQISGLEEDNPIKGPLISALSRSDSPVSLDIFRVYIGSLKAEDEKTYELLYTLLTEESGGFSPKGRSTSTDPRSGSPLGTEDTHSSS